MIMMVSLVPAVLLAALTVLAIKNQIVSAGDSYHRPTVDAKIRDDIDLSQFYQLLEASQVANNTLTYRQVTVFAPTNLAFQKYNGTMEGLVLYHMSNLAQTLEELGDSISSELDGNPPLWVTRKPGRRHDEIYINNAKVQRNASNYESTITLSPKETKKQVLHVISEVLEPVLSIPTAPAIYNPNALQFLNLSDSLNIGRHRIRLFRQRVFDLKKTGVFKAEGRYTFFLPVDEGFQPSPRPQKVDQKVVDGHIIPDHILFTAPTQHDVPFRTLAFSDNIRVSISFLSEQDAKGDVRTYVKSTTTSGDDKHPPGVVLAEIVKANIPVRNGVVHLIQRPLMIIDTTVTDFLKGIEKEDGPIYKFYEVIRDFGDNFMSDLTTLHNVTLFAPSNAAWSEPGIKQLLQDKKRMREILNLHCVKQRLPLAEIIQRNINQLFQVPTLTERKNLYFNVVNGPNENNTLTVEGGGVNATVITPDIAATNGYIHIINRVLGVPYTTILDKLRIDPMLNSTYFLGQRRDFNEQLSDTTKRFTYFVPRDYAWKNAEISYPSAYKKLFMPDFSYHAKQILERHLVVSDRAYTMAKLKEMRYNNETIELTTVRDKLRIRVRETGSNEKIDENAIRPQTEGGYFIEWERKKIHVFRPDVECTNGIIHVIDGVFLLDSDVRVTGGSSIATIVPHLVIIFVATWLL
ncbi:fasciclin-1 isoform X4 [Cephus cinctus]|uniref:Fasciclin-1 isoform X4 n=1 Tax=Cephus cinctus TaxID=211228 RepID=A0AAJ7RST9_CEPCN|nr:fasciclin-1 isoform X4 [Cephus cinctus]